MVALIICIVDFSRRNCLALAAFTLALTIVGGVFAAGHISIDTDIDKLMNPNLSWRQLEAQMERNFPQNVDLMVVVVDGATPDQAEDASAALTARLSRDTD